MSFERGEEEMKLPPVAVCGKRLRFPLGVVEGTQACEGKLNRERELRRSKHSLPHLFSL